MNRVVRTDSATEQKRRFATPGLLTAIALGLALLAVTPIGAIALWRNHQESISRAALPDPSQPVFSQDVQLGAPPDVPRIAPDTAGSPYSALTIARETESAPGGHPFAAGWCDAWFTDNRVYALADREVFYRASTIPASAPPAFGPGRAVLMITSVWPPGQDILDAAKHERTECPLPTAQSTVPYAVPGADRAALGHFGPDETTGQPTTGVHIQRGQHLIAVRATAPTQTDADELAKWFAQHALDRLRNLASDGASTTGPTS